MRSNPLLRAALTAFVLATLLAPAGTFAQAVPPAPNNLRIGDRVRLTAPEFSPFPYIGEIVRSDDANVTLRISEPEVQAGMERPISWKSVRLIEISEGYRSKVPLYAAYGAAVGAFLGLIAYAVLDSDEYIQTDSPAPPVLGGTAFGALIGVVVGRGASREEWAPLDPNSRVSLRLGASSTPFAAGLRTSF